MGISSIGIYGMILLLVSSNTIGLRADTSNWYSSLDGYSIEDRLDSFYKESHAGLNINYTGKINPDTTIKMREAVEKEVKEKLRTEKKEGKFIGGEYVTRIKSENTGNSEDVIKVGEIILRDIYIGKYIDANNKNRIVMSLYDKSSGDFKVLSESEFRSLNGLDNSITYSTSMIGTTQEDEWISERDYIDAISSEVLSIYEGIQDGRFIGKAIRTRLGSMIANEDAERVKIRYIDYGKSSLDVEDIDRVYVELSLVKDERVMYKDIELKVGINGQVIDFDIISEGSNNT